MGASAETAARRQVEQELARERAFLEDAERGGTMALLRRLEKEWVPPFELLSSRERYGALFERQTRGGTVDGRVFDGETQLADGDTIQFPPGRFEDCTFEYLPVEASSRRPKQRPIPDLNPAWK